MDQFIRTQNVEQLNLFLGRGSLKGYARYLSLAAGLSAKQGMLPRLTKNRCPARSVPLVLWERMLDF
jgi:hypothetical protein